MDFLVEMPMIGWLVIAFIAILAFILLFMAIRKGVRLGKGGNFVSVGGMDKRLDRFRFEIDKREKDRLHDEEVRKKLFRYSGEIDDKMKADERRVIRRLYEQIKDIFAPYIKCELPGMTAAEIIKDELFERVDYNCMRERLAVKERSGYITDILYSIKKDYTAFLFKIPTLPCGKETYPAWKAIRPSVEAIVNTWADETIKVINARINEKIETYLNEQNNFLLPEYKELCIDFPVQKNKQYLKKLGG